MLLKLAIISIILIAGGVLLYPELSKMVSKDNSAFNAVAQNVGDLKDITIKRVNYEMDKTIDKVGNKIDDITPNPDEINPIKKIQEKITTPQTKEIYYGQVYEKDDENNCQISVPKMAQTVNGVTELTHTITLPNCNYEKHQPLQITATTNPTTNEQTISIDSIPQTQLFETLQLKMTRTSNNSISIHYEDTSDKTIKVTVILRNSDKQLFSGEFFTSKFDTSVNDVSDSPHVIEMVVEHSEYGTVSSSVFNPQGNDEATIYGVFTK